MEVEALRLGHELGRRRLGRLGRLGAIDLHQRRREVRWFFTRRRTLHEGADACRDAASQRLQLFERRRGGRMELEHAVDPNTSTGMFESAEIKAYLNRTYAL